MMKFPRAIAWMLLAATMMATFPAMAEEVGPAASPTDETGTTRTVETQVVPCWTIAASAGVSSRDDGPDGSWQALSLTRQIGRGYVSGAMMRYHGTLMQADTALPSDYLVGTIGAGGNFAGWVTDGWISYGRQDYGRIRTSHGSRPSTGATGSPYYSIGADFGKVLALGPDWYLTPTVTGAYAHGKLLRPAPAGTGFTDLETDEPTWSTSAAVRLDHAFGRDKQHYAGLMFSSNWTSNAVSAVVAPELGNEFTQPASIDSKHYADNWFEVSATANMELTSSLHVDVFVTRGFDMISGNTTSAVLSLRKAF